MNPPKEVMEINNDAAYLITTIKSSNITTNPITSNELYAIPVRITTRSTVNETRKNLDGEMSIFMGYGESQSISGITTRRYGLLECSSIIGQPSFGSIWDRSIGGISRFNDDISIKSPCNPPSRNLNNLITIHVRKPGPPGRRSIPTFIVINARSLAEPDACSALYLELNCHNVDLTVVTETWLKSAIPSLVICPHGFTVIRNGKPYDRQGVA